MHGAVFHRQSLILDKEDFRGFNGLSGLPLINPVPFLGPQGNVVSIKSMQLILSVLMKANTCTHVIKPHRYFCEILSGYAVPYCCVCVHKRRFTFSYKTTYPILRFPFCANSVSGGGELVENEWRIFTSGGDIIHYHHEFFCF